MRVFLITQDDKFYLPGSIAFLLQLVSENHQMVGAVVSEVSPFGKKASFPIKVLRTLRTFGVRFFLQYALRYAGHFLLGKESVEDILRSQGIPVLRIKESLNSVTASEKIERYKPDVLVSVAGNEIFRRPLINLTKHGILNLHTALLPKYRGLMPTFWVIKNREAQTGVSVFLVDEGIDSGPIVVQKKIDIEGMSQAQLIRKTKHEGMVAISDALDLLESREFSLRENDDSKQTYYSFPTRQDVKEFRRVGGKFY